MQSNSFDSSNTNNRRRTFSDPTGEALHADWMTAMRRKEHREAMFADRRDAARIRVERETEKIGTLISNAEAEYFHDRELLRNALEVATQDLDGAHKSASGHLGKLGIQYIPGVTTENDVLRVPRLNESEVARSLGLKLGTGKGLVTHPAFSLVSGVLSAFASAVAYMGVFSVNVKHPLKTPAPFFGSFLLGAITAMSGYLAMRYVWGLVGAKVGSNQAAKEILPTKVLATVLTLALLTFLLCLDGFGLTRLNMGRASFNPIFAISFASAILIAGCINFAYVIGSACKAFFSAYISEATELTTGVIETDLNVKQEERKSKAVVQAALDALGNVGVVEDRIRKFHSDLKTKEKEFTETLRSLMALIPDVPCGLTAEEECELTQLEEAVQIAKTKYDAHRSSRGINYAVVENAFEENN